MVARRSAMRFAVGVATLGLVVAPLAPAQAAPPSNPVVVAPLTGAQDVSAGDRLTVRVDDPDGGNVDVAFRWRRQGAGAANPAPAFTWVAIPDTQNYVSINSEYRDTVRAQNQWIVDHRTDLNVALVSHLGDVVGSHDSRAQYVLMSGYQKVLDDAGVPNTVIPGNHDMDVGTGEAALYDEYFPVSRYANASWNSPAVRYGGYYGQNQFGPDAANRGNKDSYVLLTAGGMEFLVLNLEFNPPDDVLAWADRVIDAYPDRRAMVVTHNLLYPDGSLSASVVRPGGNNPEQVWSKLIAPNCSIFMAINGHNHVGSDGEANRAMTNSCGRSVQLALSNYQQLERGGDGWLRYYTFDPATNSISARTYSPTLGRYDTDAESQFTLPYDMSVAPAAFEQLGDEVTVASGGTASVPLPQLEPGATYEWYAVADDGTSTTNGPVATFTARDPEAGKLANDAFERQVPAGWGSADRGGAWSVSTASAFSVSGGRGRVSVPAGSSRYATLASTNSTDTDLTAEVALDKAVAGGSIYAALAARSLNSSNQYRVRLVALTGNGVRAEISRVAAGAETVLAWSNIAGLTHTAGARYRLRFQAVGTSPTALKAKLWVAGQTEPSAWTVQTTDSTAALQSPGGIGLWAYVSSGATNGPIGVSIDDLAAVTTTTPTPPVNSPPVASFTVSSSDLTASVDGAGSSDPDGSVVSYAWLWGDGSSGSGRTASHAYGSAGSYTVRLTVTDDRGATATTTRSVTVTAPPVSGLARDDFGRTLASGWGSADLGGAWTVSTASAFSVGSGVGRVSTPAGSSRWALLAGVSSTSTEVTGVLSVDKVATGSGAYAAVMGRAVTSASGYRARIVWLANGQVRAELTRTVGSTETFLGNATLAGVTNTAGARYRFRFRVTGTSPTTLQARVWVEGAAEPGGWTVQTTDSASELQAPGGVGVWFYTSSGATNGPHTLSVDELAAVRP